MRKTKLTRFVSLFLSAAMVLTALPVMAAVPENSVVAEQSTTNTENKSDANDLTDVLSTVETTSAPTDAAATATPKTDATPADSSLATPTATAEAVATPAEAVATNAMLRDSVPANGYGTAGFGTKPPEAAGIQLGDIFDIGGNAFVETDYPNVAVIAKDAVNQSGYMWSKEKLNLNQAFETEMYMFLSKKYNGSPTSSIADGMTFVLHNDSRGNTALGSLGEGIGAYTVATQGIRNSVIVEFDTYLNGSDPTFIQNQEGHVAAFMFQNGHLPSKAEHEAAGVTKFKLRSAKSTDPALQNEWVRFTASWQPDGSGNGVLKIHFGNDGDPAANVYDKEFQVDDYLTYFGSNEVYWGFTAATGGSSAIHAAAVTKLPDQELAADKKVLYNGQEIAGGAVSVGDIITYQLTSSVFEEADPETIAPVIMEDELPAGLEYVSGSATQWDVTNTTPVAVTPTIDGNKLTFATGVSLEKANDFVTISFNVKVTDAGYAKTLTNTAQIYSEKTADKKASTNPAEVIVNADYVVQYYYEQDGGTFSHYSSEDEVVSSVAKGTVVSTYPDKSNLFGAYTVDTSQTATSLTVGDDKTQNVWKVYYKYIMYPITYDTDGNGTLSYYSDSVRQGKAVTDVPTTQPNTNYTFDYWTIEGSDGLYNDQDLLSYTITGPTHITAHFREILPPVIQETGRSTIQWTNQDVIVDYKVTAQSDFLGQVVADGQVVVDQNTQSKSYTGQFTFTENGTKKIEAFAIDRIGSDFPVYATPLDVDVTNIDKVNPTITGSLVKESNVVANDVKTAFTFDDKDSGLKDASGIDNQTKTFYLYQKNAAGGYDLKQTILFDDLDSKFSEIPSGKYYYAVSVKDNANNYSDSNGKNTNNPPEKSDGETPDEPTDGPIYINVDKPIITPSYTFDDGTPYNEGTWTNKDVTVKYGVDGNGADLIEVLENGTNKIVTPEPTFTGGFKVTEEGIHQNKLDAKNEALKEADTKEFTIKIDKTKPVIDMPDDAKNIVDVLTNTKFTDDASGVKDGSDHVKVIDKKTGVTVLEGTKKEVLDQIANGDLSDGDYTIEVDVQDNAGNQSDTRREDVYYLKGTSATTVTISYNPDHVWTNGDVLATYTIKSTLAIQKVTVDGEEVTLVNDQGTLNFTANPATPKVITVTTVASEETYDVSVSWIDKVAPTVTNLPSGDADHILTAADIKDATNGVQFADTGSPNANLQSDVESGVNDSTKIVYFYQSGRLVKESNWADLETDMAALPSGKYTYVVSVEDNAGNYGDSNGRKFEGSDQTTPDREKPDAPTDQPEVIINPVAPEITTKLINQDGSIYTQGTWVNKDITVEYTVDGKGMDLSSVTVDGTNKLTSPVPTFNGSFVQNTTEQKTYTINGLNEAGKSVSATVELWIDKIAPVPTLPAADITIDTNVFTNKIIDLTDAGGSQLDDNATSLVFTPFQNGKYDTAGNIEFKAASTWDSSKLVDGTTYKITLAAKDNAGNTATKSVAGIKYFEDADKAKKNNEIDAWVIRRDSINKEFVIVSKTYGIQKVTIKVSGKIAAVETPVTGTKRMSTLVSVAANQTAEITVELTGGSVVTLTYNGADNTINTPGTYEAEDHPKVQTLTVDGSLGNKKNWTTTDFKTIVAAPTFKYSGVAATEAKVTKYWARRQNLGNYTGYLNMVMIGNLARVNPYEVILEVTYEGKTYYFDGSSPNAVLTKPTSGGYVVQGLS